MSIHVIRPAPKEHRTFEPLKAAAAREGQHTERDHASARLLVGRRQRTIVLSVMSAIRRPPTMVSAILLLASALFFLHQAIRGIWFLPYPDEPEHLLGGMMLDRGAILYRDFVTEHGPTTFIATQLYGAVFGWGQPNLARAMLIVLAALSVAAIGSIPVRVGGIHVRLWASALFLSLVSSVWLFQGLYLVSYYAIAGLLLTISIAVFVAPSWYGVAPGWKRGFVGGAGLVLVTATAYSYAPACLLLGSSAVLSERTKRTGRAALFGFGCGIAASAMALFVWLVLFGDVIGYIVFHLVENQVYYAPYIHFSFQTFLLGLIPSLDAFHRVNTLSLVLNCLGLALFLLIDRQRPHEFASNCIPILLGWLGLLSLQARGTPFLPNGPFLLTSICLFSIALPIAVSDHSHRNLFGGWPRPLLVVGIPAFLVQAFVMGAAHASNIFAMPANLKTRYDIGVSQDPLPAHIRNATRADDSILVLPYAPHIYLETDRQPMNRYHDYFPVDADYAKSPWFGRTHDLCVDLPKPPPAVIYILSRDFFFIGTDGHYLDCVFSYVAAHYRQSKQFHGLYLRSDIASTQSTSW